MLESCWIRFGRWDYKVMRPPLNFWVHSKLNAQIAFNFFFSEYNGTDTKLPFVFSNVDGTNVGTIPFLSFPFENGTGECYQKMDLLGFNDNW